MYSHAQRLSHASEAPTPKSAPIYEFTPYEFGTWDSSNITQGGYFSPIEYLGSNSTNGTCYKGFDQLSFITGVSATLFNSIGSITSALFNNASFPFLNSTTQNVATVPNPFQGYTGGENPDPNDTEITLVDAGETNQNLPLLPLLVPQRNVDAIIAFDSSSNTDSNWPDGSALYTTYNETKDTEFEMPAVPSPNGFINGGFNTRPTFFGCNDTDKPLVIYFPNYPYTTLTNISTFTFKQPTNLTGSHRANGYTAENRSDTCAQCFSAFCWNGEDNTTTPGPYLPAIGAPAFLSTVDLNITMPEPSNTSTGTSGSTSAKPSGSTKDSGAMRAGTHVLAIAAAGAAAFFTL
jgi:lysophospholipase